MRKKLLLLALSMFWALPCFAQQVDTAWVRRYNGPGNSDDRGRALAVDHSGNVYVTGWSCGISSDSDYVTIKYYPNGDTAWLRRYNGTGNADDRAYALALDDSGNVYVTGTSNGGSSDHDYATIKYYPNGNTAWVRRWSSPGWCYDWATGLDVDHSGNVYVTGLSYSGPPDENGYVTIKYYPNGDEAWVRRYDGPGNGDDQAVALALDHNSGSVYVTGWSWDTVSGYDYATIKYLTNGDTAWVRRYDGPGNNEDRAKALVVDDSGNVYVTGYSLGSGTSTDYATIKYKENGDTAWVRRYNGPANNADVATALSLDRSGDLYVTGYSVGIGSGYDLTTIKYYPDGDTAWVRRYNGPANADDGATENYVVTDDLGNFYVTGWSWGSGSERDYVTIKYYSNGDTAWVRRYNGPGNDWDEGRAIAVDGSGDVYVTGLSRGIGTGHDYATIRYSKYRIRPDTLKISVYSPVDLIVTDPNLDSIGLNFNTIVKGSTYDSTLDLDGDGDRDDRVTIPYPLVGQYVIKVVADPGGSGTYTEAIKLDGNEATVVALNAEVPGPGQVDTVVYTVPEYLHGDANRDGKKTVSDVVFLINYLFKGGIAPDPVNLGDVNFCKENPPVQPGKPTVADVVYMVNYLFKGGPPPCS